MVITTKRTSDRNGNATILVYCGAHTRPVMRVQADPALCSDEQHKSTARSFFDRQFKGRPVMHGCVALPDVCNHDFVHMGDPR